MTSKLRTACITGASILACTAAWAGCSSSDSSPAATTNDAGGTVTADAAIVALDASPATDSGKDAAKDAAPIDSGGLTGPFVDIPFGTCPDNTKCGGDLTGTWTVKGGCVTDALLADAKQQCPGLVESDVHFTARGYVVGTATTLFRNTEVEFTGKLAIPGECKPTMAPFNTCAAVGAGLVTLAKLESANCTDDVATGGCNCDVASSFIDQGSDTYTTDNGTVTTSAGRTFDYCVDVAVSQLTYIETTARAAPVTLILGK